MFLEQQISLLELFVKDHVTLKTGVMMLTIQLCHHRSKLHFKIYRFSNGNNNNKNLSDPKLLKGSVEEYI